MQNTEDLKYTTLNKGYNRRALGNLIDFDITKYTFTTSFEAQQKWIKHIRDFEKSSIQIIINWKQSQCGQGKLILIFKLRTVSKYNDKIVFVKNLKFNILKLRQPLAIKQMRLFIQISTQIFGFTQIRIY